jgi:hypothetical protein
MEPLSGPDGTQPPRSDDALAGTGATASDRRWSDVRLPPMPAGADPRAHAAEVEYWMDDDAERAAAVTGPPRDVPTPRPIPRPTTRRADLQRAYVVPEPRTDAHEHDDEPEWLRERREEAEFQAEFGNWRAGPAGPTGHLPPRRSPLARLPLLLLLVVVALVLWFALVP